MSSSISTIGRKGVAALAWVAETSARSRHMCVRWSIAVQQILVAEATAWHSLEHFMPPLYRPQEPHQAIQDDLGDHHENHLDYCFFGFVLAIAAAQWLNEEVAEVSKVPVSYCERHHTVRSFIPSLAPSEAADIDDYL
jgi:hypothetical protein